MRRCEIFAFFALLLVALTAVPGASSQTSPSGADRHDGDDFRFNTTASPTDHRQLIGTVAESRSTTPAPRVSISVSESVKPVKPAAEREIKVPYRITPDTAAGQGVNGYTNISPDSELKIEMESESEVSPSVPRPEANLRTVDTYTAPADFANYSAGTNFTAQTPDIDSNENFSDEEGSRIVEDEMATVTVADQESDGSEFVVDSAQLSDGGFIVIHDSTLLDGEFASSVIGNSEYLEAGTHEDIRITLDEPQDGDFTAIAMPHLDTNDNEAYDFPNADGPYTNRSSAVFDRASVVVETPTAMPTPTPTPEPTEIAPERTTDGRESEIPTTATDSRTAVVTTSPQTTTEQQTEPPPPDSLRDFLMEIFQTIVGPQMLVVVGISLVTVLIVITWPEEEDNN